MTTIGLLVAGVIGPVITYMLKKTAWGAGALRDIGVAVNGLISVAVFLVAWAILTRGDVSVLETWIAEALALAWVGSSAVGLGKRIAR